MIVEKYKRKINHWLKAYKFLYKFRVMLIAFAVLLSSTAVTLLSIKGLVTDVIKISDSFYGDKLEYESKGIFENYIHYEFKTESASEWSKEIPYKAGTYQIRGVSKDIFGNFRKGNETTFTIKPKIVEVNIKSDTITYGDRPTLDIDLAFQDKITDFDFEYSDIDVDSMSASLYINYESIVVVNSSNEDVSSCYNFNGSASSSSTLGNNDFKVNLKKRNIVFETNDIYEYDGNEHGIENIKIYEGELYEGDSYLIDKHNYEVYGGFYKTFPVLKFVNKSNKDITKLYSYSFSSSSYLTISAREITIETMDFSKEYDGRISTFDNRYKIIEGSLVNGDKLELGCPSFINAGNYENRPNYTFISKDGNNVSRSYKLTIKSGKYVINPRKIRIKEIGEDKIYDGYSPYCFCEYDESRLLEGHVLERYRYYEDTINEIHIGTYETLMRYRVLDVNEKDVSSNYEFIITKDSVTISKRNITIETGTGKVPYTGNLVGYPDYSIKSGSLAETDSLACLTYRKEVELGIYENEMTFSITHKTGKDVTNDYNINIVLGKFTIVEEVNGGEGSGGGGIPGGEPIAKDPLFDPLNPLEPSSGEGEGYLFKYNTNTSGNIYFRQLVLGDYTKKGFTSAPNLYLGEQSVNPIYHFYNANVSSIKPSFMNIEYMVDQTEHDPVPYNIKESTSYTPINDNSFQYEGKNHSFEYLYYDYIEDKGKSLRKYNGVGSEEYANQVRWNYSEVPDSTRTALLKIINSNNLRKNTTYDTIKAVKDYVQNVAEYSFGVSYVDSEDYVIDFLTKTKKGICVHYASAATLILRCLGYSSRIACGYSGGKATANKDMFVGIDRAHAWTEVFLEEYNQWVNIEVTGSSSGGSGGSGGGSFEPTESIVITSESQNFVYDREYHSYPKYTLSKELPTGYTLKVEFLASIQNVGSVNNSFTFSVIDKAGKDVTGALNIEAKFGVLSVLPKKLLVKTEDKTISLKDLPNYYPEYMIEGNIVTLNKTTQTFISAITKPGTYENVVFIFCLEEMDTGIDVTNNYKIEYDYGTLTVTS